MKRKDRAAITVIRNALVNNAVLSDLMAEDDSDAWNLRQVKRAGEALKRLRYLETRLEQCGNEE